jgi:hypothetical protein
MFSQAPPSHRRSCAATVARVLVLSTALGRRPPSEDTASSWRARAQGPARVLQRLSDQASDSLELDVPQAWLGHRRRSHIQPLDGGLPLGVPETKENQQAWPLPPSGIGIPPIAAMHGEVLGPGRAVRSEAAAAPGDGGSHNSGEIRTTP